MSNNSSDDSRKVSTFGWLLSCFTLLLISLPFFYFGSGTGGDGQITFLLICGFILLSAGMIISITIQT